MSAMGEMPMPGGWTMSMAWMRMPRQTWPGAAASFLGMWVVMMVAMMMPSLLPADAGMAWRHGLRLGLHCSHCCAGLMAILLVIGVMDLRAMAVVAAAISVERLAPAGERVARAIGAVVVGAGLFLIARAAGLG
jgi:predicted metal-binding membrane protein